MNPEISSIQKNSCLGFFKTSEVDAASPIISAMVKNPQHKFPVFFKVKKSHHCKSNTEMSLCVILTAITLNDCTHSQTKVLTSGIHAGTLALTSKIWHALLLGFTNVLE